MRLTVDGLRYTPPGAAWPVLAGTTCSLEDGETLAVVGPSGSGKTTFVSILGGLLAPAGGTVAWRDSGGVRDPREVTTWVLQTVSLLPERSVLDNVMLGAFLDGAGRAEARGPAGEALDSMGLANRADDRASVLSGGEAQRVAIARALASARPVLLADEPTGQLDSRTTDLVLDAMFAVAARTIVLVTHDERAARRCDRVLRLDGRRPSPPPAS